MYVFVQAQKLLASDSSCPSTSIITSPASHIVASKIETVTATATATATTTDTASDTASASAFGKSVRKLHRRPDSERQLEPLPARRKRSLWESLDWTDEDIFTRAFTVITSPKDITSVTPPNLQRSETLQGSYIITYGGVYRSSSVELVPTELFSFGTDVPQIALQPKTTPAIDEDFTLGGKCTTTNGKTITGIISHSCFYDLCLGSPTDCINIYAGGRFNFSPIKDDNSRGILVNTQNNGILDPEAGLDDPRKLQNQASDDRPVGTKPNGFILSPGFRAALPPSFPGFGFGGTGRYQGIKCNFDLITVAQRSFFPLVTTTETPTASPTLTDEPTVNKNNNRDLSQEDEQEEEENNRDLQTVDLDTGVIVQKIFFTCNQRLPLGPKAI
ncbi:hypothetical protein FRACYDRAFT_248814 [Fragilariopsis cylindrus CCMP1102]|uniref:Uncharacterized protein n=1 Tax=Fragilariopsis cylindrus CCMP1102 TaxID=635003 RepID=A0A1E7EU61_9STRA|nr:hypothetical protein FRACYDRAFT_248814 [Fragilariopsis cylindrus CCMP1102]|eukprot:OEU09334.1 hypothetical protein FRACYDRAFT_248814 [Fragilariopsis cylindrus CCMP1102]